MNLSSVQFLIPFLLPVPMALLAGALRQDKLNPLINEAVTWCVVFLVALVSFVFGIGGHLTGNIYIDFMAVVAYSGVLVHTEPFKPLLLYLQSNLLSLGVSGASKVEQATIADVKATLDHLIHFLTSGGATTPQPPSQAQPQVPPPAPQSPSTAAAASQQSVQQVPFPTASMPSGPGSTFPAMPVPPRG